MTVNKLISDNWNRISELMSNRTELEKKELTTRIMIQNSVHTWNDKEIIDIFEWLDKQLDVEND